jgi:outer membrane protein OmpA-like peptidoglycan-associated protein
MIFIDFLLKHPTIQVEIAGHTDSDSDEIHNQKPELMRLKNS